MNFSEIRKKQLENLLEGYKSEICVGPDVILPLTDIHNMTGDYYLGMPIKYEGEGIRVRKIHKPWELQLNHC